MADLLVNGIAMSTRNWWLEVAPDAGDLLEADYARERIAGRRGPNVSALLGYRDRELTLRGGMVTAANTAAARLTAEDELKDLLGAGPVTLQLDAGLSPAREIDGLLRSLTFEPFGHPLQAVKSTCTAKFLCPEGDWRKPTGDAVALAVAGTRYSVPLGPAASDPIVRLMGLATNPVFRIRTVSGYPVVELTFTVVLASTDYLDIDNPRGVIEKVASGVRTNAISLLTSGRFPFPIDPAWGSYRDAKWPTAEVSAGQGEVLYAKRYR